MHSTFYILYFHRERVTPLRCKLSFFQLITVVKSLKQLVHSTQREIMARDGKYNNTYQFLQITPFNNAIAIDIKALQKSLVVICTAQPVLNFLAENKSLAVHACHDVVGKKMTHVNKTKIPYSERFPGL